MKSLLLAVYIFIACSFSYSQDNFDVIIIGGGASGTTAGIQSARSGARTLIVEETNWLGGMLTAAGVSAIDGNHKMPAGIWGEFRQNLYDHYGGPSAVATGWVSNTLFEPSVGNKILKNMVAEEKELKVWYQSSFVKANRVNGVWNVSIIKNGKPALITGKILIDATELGDVMASLGVPYSIGMDDKEQTGEEYAPEQSNDIIQDLTYVVVLKDYGKEADKTIRKPAGYDPSVFRCCCDISDPASHDSPTNNCFKMLQYGRLPNNKYMINWPKCGNDIYLNIIEKSSQERIRLLEEARLHTLRFVYYIQTELGYKNLGIAEDEFPTRDKLPMIPYHRESRRIKALTTFSLPYVADPYNQKFPLYRTGIAVGDYTIDHHHLKNPKAPAIDFVKIRVPSYNVPLGSLIPAGSEGLIVAEKSIGVTNIVNGATRLQPVVLQIGQAAGLLAALSAKGNIQPAQIDVRSLQGELLKVNGYIMPFIDVDPSDPQFETMQKIGATGIMKGKGVPYLWANQTWFYPELPMSAFELLEGMKQYYPSLNLYRAASGDMLDERSLISLFEAAGFNITVEQVKEQLAQLKIEPIEYDKRKVLSRRAISALLNTFLDPFSRPVDITGQLLMK